MEDEIYYLENILRQDRITNEKLSDLIQKKESGDRAIIQTIESGDKAIAQAVREVNITNTALLMVMTILLIYNFIVRCLK